MPVLVFFKSLYVAWQLLELCHLKILSNKAKNHSERGKDWKGY